MLEEAHRELEKGDVRQAVEKIWGAATLAVKAYAWWREGRRLASHRELWEYKDKIADELGEWILHTWHEANAMHTCFYETWCTKKSVQAALKQVEKLVKKIETKIKKT